MGSDLIEALTQQLGADRVTDCRHGDADPRTARNLSGQPVGQPLCWVRPDSTDACAAVARLAARAGTPIVAVGDATTFWDPLRVADAVVIDARALVGPLDIDADTRLARAGAGRSIRAIDRAARAHGLCLEAYPDTDGETTAGSLAAVGSTAGLGNGRHSPVSQVRGLTLVSHQGAVLPLGAAHRLGGPATSLLGLPDPAGLVFASQGRAGVVTELTLALSPAAFLSRATARIPPALLLDSPRLMELLRVLRAHMDGGNVDSLRLELGGDGHELRAELMLRCRSLVSHEAAGDHARALASSLESWSGSWAHAVQSEAARTGHDPEHDWHYTIPRGTHRARVEGGGFLGVEVWAPWGPGLLSALGVLGRLFEALADQAPMNRRLGLYPYGHGVSIGVQCVSRPGAGSIDAMRGQLTSVMPALLETGAIPYRPGHLWDAAIERHLEGRTGAHTGLLVDQLLRTTASFPPAPEAPARARAAGLVGMTRRALPHLDARPLTEDSLALRFGEAEVIVTERPPQHPGAFARTEQFSLTYEIRGELAGHREEARLALRHLARALHLPTPQTVSSLRAAMEAGSAGAMFDPALADEPAALLPLIDDLNRRVRDDGEVPALVGLPPCLDLRIRPILPRPTPPHPRSLAAPCAACGAAGVCDSAGSAVRPGLRALRHGNEASAARACMSELRRFFGASAQARAEQILETFLGGRNAPDAPPHFPIEFSVQARDGELLPRIRFVDYGPDMPPPDLDRMTRSERRSRELLRIIQDAVGTEGCDAARDWLSVVSGDGAHPVETSLGVDVGPTGADLKAQLYAYANPGARSTHGELVRSLVTWAGGDQGVASRLARLVTEGPGRLVLMAHASAPAASRLTKIYVSVALDHTDTELDLAPPSLGPLAAHAPGRGLAVLECGDAATRWVKWDFPVATHFQRSDLAIGAFAAAVCPERERDVAALLTGDAFVAWPTWMSVGRNGGTLYFIPR